MKVWAENTTAAAAKSGVSDYIYNDTKSYALWRLIAAAISSSDAVDGKTGHIRHALGIQQQIQHLCIADRLCPQGIFLAECGESFGKGGCNALLALHRGSLPSRQGDRSDRRIRLKGKAAEPYSSREPQAARGENQEP